MILNVSPSTWIGGLGNGGLGDGIMELKWQLIVSPSSGVGVCI